MPRVALVLNPASRAAGRALEMVGSACAAAGLGAPLVLETSVADPGPGQARYALAQGVERVVVAGGDGTVRLVAGALGEAGAAGEGGSGRAVLGVVAVGTANLAARTAGLPRRDLAAAARVAVTAAGRPADLGRARLETSTGELVEEPFMVVAGLGQDAATLGEVRPGVKARARWLAYFAPAVRRLLLPGHGLRVTADGVEVAEGPLWSVLGVNAARLPARAQVVPGARLDDGRLHVVLVAPAGLPGWAHVARTAWRGPGGRRAGVAAYPTDHRALRYRSAGTLEVVADEPVAAQVDGDVVADVVRATITLAPGSLLLAR